MNDKHEVGQSLVVIRTLVFPALVKQIVEFIPLFEFENSLKLELDDLEVL